MTSTGVAASGDRIVIPLKHLPLCLIAVPPEADVKAPTPQPQIGKCHVLIAEQVGAFCLDDQPTLTIPTGVA